MAVTAGLVVVVDLNPLDKLVHDLLIQLLHLKKISKSAKQHPHIDSNLFQLPELTLAFCDLRLQLLLLLLVRYEHRLEAILLQAAERCVLVNLLDQIVQLLDSPLPRLNRLL